MNDLAPGLVRTEAGYWLAPEVSPRRSIRPTATTLAWSWKRNRSGSRIAIGPSSPPSNAILPPAAHCSTSAPETAMWPPRSNGPASPSSPSSRSRRRGERGCARRDPRRLRRPAVARVPAGLSPLLAPPSPERRPSLRNDAGLSASVVEQRRSLRPLPPLYASVVVRDTQRHRLHRRLRDVHFLVAAASHSSVSRAAIGQLPGAGTPAAPIRRRHVSARSRGLLRLRGATDRPRSVDSLRR